MRNVKLYINGNTATTKAIWATNSKVKTKQVDRIDLVIYNACFDSDRVSEIWIKKLNVERTTKNKIYSALKVALTRNIRVFFNLEGWIEMNSYDIDHINEFWSMYFEDKALAEDTLTLLKESHMLKAFIAQGVQYLVDGLSNYVRNSGYDCGFVSESLVSKHSSAVWDAKDGIQGNAWVDDRGLTHYTTVGQKFKTVSTVTLNDLLRAYIQVKYYESIGLEPERKTEQRKRDEFFQDMYGMSEEEYKQKCYAVKGYCTQTTECDINPEWIAGDI